METKQEKNTGKGKLIKKWSKVALIAWSCNFLYNAGHSEYRTYKIEDIYVKRYYSEFNKLQTKQSKIENELCKLGNIEQNLRSIDSYLIQNSLYSQSQQLNSLNIQDLILQEKRVYLKEKIQVNKEEQILRNEFRQDPEIKRNLDLKDKYSYRALLPISPFIDW